MKKYRVKTRWPDGIIHEIEVERETEKSIWIRGNRELKHTEYSRIFDTYCEAYEFVVSLLNGKIEQLQRKLDKYTEQRDGLINRSEECWTE